MQLKLFDIKESPIDYFSRLNFKETLDLFYYNGFGITEVIFDKLGDIFTYNNKLNIHL